MNTKYDARVQKINSLLCVGLDPDFEKIPERFRAMAEPQFEFNKYIIDQTHECAVAYKANSAFYEAKGTQGMTELKKTIDYLKSEHPDIFTIDDAKRGDIGNTNNAYAESIFDWLGFDAITLQPYQGGEALQPYLSRADKVCIILCRTSNSGSGEFQDLVTDGKPQWQTVAERVATEWNKHNNCMLVVGATYPKEMKTIRSVAANMTFLVPGIGAQGGDIMATLAAGLTAQGDGLIINSSRGIIFAENPHEEAKKLRDEINTHRT